MTTTRTAVAIWALIKEGELEALSLADVRLARAAGMPVVEILREALLARLDEDLHIAVESLLVLNHEEYVELTARGADREEISVAGRRNAKLMADLKAACDADKASVRGMAGDMVFVRFFTDAGTLR